MLSSLIVSALKTALTVTQFGKRLVLARRVTAPRWGDSQDQDQDSHGRQDWRLLQTLRGSKITGQLDFLLVNGSLIIPDTEEVTSSNLVPPTRSPAVPASGQGRPLP